MSKDDLEELARRLGIDKNLAKQSIEQKEKRRIVICGTCGKQKTEVNK